MRKFFWITILIFGLLLLAIWSPWRQLDFNLAQLFGLEVAEETSGLQVVSLAGTLEVYLDSKLEGTATPESPFILPKVTPGDHLVTLKRKSDTAGAFADLHKLLRFTTGTDVVLAYELGPTLEFSAGHIITASGSKSSTDSVTLNLNTNAIGAEAYLGETKIGLTPLQDVSVSTLTQQRLKIIKQGYEVQEFLLFPEEQSERDKLRGLTLEVEVNLFLQPIEVDIQ